MIIHKRPELIPIIEDMVEAGNNFGAAALNHAESISAVFEINDVTYYETMRSRVSNTKEGKCYVWWKWMVEMIGRGCWQKLPLGYQIQKCCKEAVVPKG